MAIKPSIAEPKIVFVEISKKKLRERRKRKKSTAKEKTCIITMNSKFATTIHKMTPPLKIYEELVLKKNVKRSSIYDKLSEYILTQEEMLKNGFPIEKPGSYGKIILSPKQHPGINRCCCKCYKDFTIIDNTYISDTECRYHTSRMLLGEYPCCKGSYSSVGCRSAKYHVTTEAVLDNVIFRRVDGKRQVKTSEAKKIYALDCEMVYTTNGLEVAKVAVVNVEGKAEYSAYVQPDHMILNYNTEYSGITAKDLEGVKITLTDVQSVLLRILKDAILVGHALHNDLMKLGLIVHKVVDTQVVFKSVGHGRPKLKTLAEMYLRQVIQDSDSGHDAFEDARVCMELMLHKVKFDLCDNVEVSNKENNGETFRGEFRIGQPGCARVFQPGGGYCSTEVDFRNRSSNRVL